MTDVSIEVETARRERRESAIIRRFSRSWDDRRRSNMPMKEHALGGEMRGAGIEAGRAGRNLSWRWPRMKIAVGFGLTAVICFLALADAAAAEPKRLIFLHSYGQNFKPWGDYAKALRQELDGRSPWPLDIRDFSLVTARGIDENAETKFTEYLGALFSDNNPPDVIVAFGGPAAAYVQRHRSALFPHTPMLLTAVDQRRVQQANLTENDTVIAVRLSIPILFGNILRLLPETKTVAVVVGNSPNERFWIDEMKRELQPFQDRFRLVFTNDLSFEDTLKQAASLPPNSAIWWNQPQVDGAGAVHEGEQALKKLYAVANAPIFTFDDSFFDGEIVGGPMTSVTVGARTAADVVIRMLNGEKPAAIKTPTLEYGPAKYDWKQLRRWGISESRLPSGSEILFREPSAWDAYRWQIMAICGIILVQAMLISLLLQERRRREFAEVQSRQRMSELAHVNRFSTAGELTASIAHEINQPLGAIRANAEAAELIAKSAKPDLNEIREITADIRRDEERVSEVILRLRSLLKKAPFEAHNFDLNNLVGETMSFLAGLAVGRQVEILQSLTPEPLPVNGDRIQLQQVILNLIINAIEAMSEMPVADRQIRVSSRRHNGFAEVSIADQGPGISSDLLSRVFEPFFTTKAHGMGMGLSIARTIVEAHQGRLSAESQTGGGALFRVRLPLSSGS
jgi:signal transduction histidine kinase